MERINIVLKSRLKKLFKHENIYLLKTLIKSEFQRTDHNSFFGMLWSLLSPFALTLGMYLLFRTRFGEGVPSYALHVLIGIVITSAFLNSTTILLTIFHRSSELILNSTVPRECILISALSVHIYKFIIELTICFLGAVIVGMVQWQYVIFIPFLFIAYVLFIYGISMAIVILHCFAKDIQHIWMLVGRLLFIATPIFYQLNALSPWTAKIVYFLNPITPFILSFRVILMDSIGYNVQVFAVIFHSLFVGCFAFVVGYICFILFDHLALERI